MTLLNFLNCASVAVLPCFMIYKTSGLAEYRCFWKCVQAAVAYVVCQLCKMLFLATFLVDSMPFYGEALKHSLDILDLVVIQIIMTRGGVYGDLRFMVAGFGWACAELICTRVIPFWVGARGVEFSWEYLQMALDSNISMIFHLCTAMLLAQWRSSDRSNALSIVLLALAFRGIAFDALAMTEWNLLAVKAGVAIPLGLASLRYVLSRNQKGYSNVFPSSHQ